MALLCVLKRTVAQGIVVLLQLPYIFHYNTKVTICFDQLHSHMLCCNTRCYGYLTVTYIKISHCKPCYAMLGYVTL